MLAAFILFVLPFWCSPHVFAETFPKHGNSYSGFQNHTTESELDIEVTPAEHTIVLLGQRRTIHIYCMSEVTAGICVKASLEGNPSHLSPVKVLEDEEVVYFTVNSSYADSATRAAKAYASVDVLGLRPGRAKLKLELLHANQTLIGTLLESYEIIVTEKLNLVHDGFVYILCSIQFLAVLMLGLRMRGAATKEVLTRPCALITALLAQTVFVPLICLGCSVLLALDQHSTAALLIVGCCPPAVVGVMMAVVQQGHVELSIILLLLETLTAFGIMPGWLFTYGHFLGLAYTEVSFPYFHISAAVAVAALPTLIGILLRRCTPRVLPQLDKAIQPVSLLVVMVAVTIAIYNFMEKWALITWRLLLASSCVPLASLLVAITLCIVTKQKVPQLKAVAISTVLQNTLLATTIIQTSYSVESSSVMAVSIACLDMMSLGGLFLLYLLHIVLWVLWPMYRMHHDNIGVSGVSKSFSERLVRNMLKAGEIRFCSRAANRRRQEDNDGTPFCSISGTITNGNTVPQTKTRSSLNTHLSSSVSNRLANLNLSFLGSLHPKVSACSPRSSSASGDSEESELSLHYFTRALPLPAPESAPTDQNNQSIEANRDATSMKYDLMVKRDSSVQRQIANSNSNRCATRLTDLNQENLCLVRPTHQSDTKTDHQLEKLKELDRMAGYANCTGTSATGQSGVCECAAESDNNTNDIIEILISSTEPPEVSVESLEGGHPEESSEAVKFQLHSDCVIDDHREQTSPEIAEESKVVSEVAADIVEVDYHSEMEKPIEDKVIRVDILDQSDFEELKKKSEKDAAVWLEDKL